MTSRLSSASLLVILLACMAGCGDAPKQAPVSPDSSPAPAPAPRSAAETVPWNPDLLKPLPEELVHQPGSGESWLDGKVVDEAGDPVAGAAVEIHAMPTGRSVGLTPLLHAATTSAADGTFRVGPGPSPWWRYGLLSAVAPGYRRTALRGKASTDGDMGFADPGTPVTVTLRTGVEVSGTVRTESGGAPYEPARIWAVSDHEFFDIVETDAKGAFTVAVPEGPVVFNVLAGAHEPARQSVRVRSEANPSLRLVVKEASDVRGRVVDAKTGRAIAGAGIRCYYGQTRMYRSDKEGRFVLPRYWFRGFQVRAPGYAERIYQLALERDAVAEVEIRLQPGFVARGVVKDLEGKPVAGVRLRSLLRGSDGHWLDVMGPASSEDGTFTFVGLPAIEHGREVRLFGDRRDWAFGWSKPLTDLPGGALVEDIEVVIARLITLKGVVHDENAVRRAAELRITWALPSELRDYGEVVPLQVQCKSLDDGTWAAQLPERSDYRVELRGEAFRPRTAEGTTPAWTESGAEVVDLEVEAGLAIRGKVVDSDAQPVTHGSVRVEPSPPSSDRPSRNAKVNSDGTFEAGGLDAGKYDFSVVTLPGYLQEIVLGVEAGGEPVTVCMRRPGGVMGRIVDRDGNAPADEPFLLVEALEDSTPLPPRRQTTIRRDDRSFTLGPLAPGPYRLMIRCGDLRLDVERIEVLHATPTDLGDLVLQEAGIVSGSVTMGGRPVTEGVVDVAQLRGDGRRIDAGTFLLDSGGRYRAGGLLSGSHIVSVRPFDGPRLERSVEVELGEIQTLDLTLAAPAALDVEVVNAEGKPAPGARVTLSRSDGASLEFWQMGSRAKAPHSTDREGNLVCSGLPAGACRVFADVPGVGSGEALVELEAGETGSVRIALSR